MDTKDGFFEFGPLFGSGSIDDDLEKISSRRGRLRVVAFRWTEERRQLNMSTDSLKVVVCQALIVRTAARGVLPRHSTV